MGVHSALNLARSWVFKTCPWKEIVTFFFKLGRENIEFNILIGLSGFG